MHRFFSLTLGPYDGAEAVATLPGQLELLRVLRDLGRPEIALVNRLRTFALDDGSLAAEFSCLCVARRASVLTDIESSSLLDHAVVTYLPAWPVSHVEQECTVKAAHTLRLAPTDGEWSRLPIKLDWAPLVDLLRRREYASAVEFSCTYVEPEAVPPFAEAVVPTTAVVGDENEANAAEFFVRVAQQPSGENASRGRIALQVTMHSEEPIDEVFARLVGRLALGLPTRPVEVSESTLFPSDSLEGLVIGHPEEVIRVMHAPYGRIAGRGLDGFRPAYIPVRFSVPEVEGDLVLGQATRERSRGDSRVSVPMRAPDRARHTYIIGKTGSGKTNLLKNLVLQDVQAGRGVAVIDPHGDLVDYVAKRAGDRTGDVTLLDFGDPAFVPAFNPLLVDASTVQDRELVVEEVLDATIRRAYSEFSGPVFEDTVRMVLSTVASPHVPSYGPPSLAFALEYLRDLDTGKWITTKLGEDRRLQQQWQNFVGMQGHTVAEHGRWVLSKFSDFTPGSILTAATSAPRSPLSFDRIVSDRSVLLIKVPEALLGPRASALLGGLIFARIRRAALSQRETGGDPFAVYVDEFQKFVQVELESLVAEARKFNLALVFAHQNLRQLDAFSRYEGSSSPRLREAIFSNVGTLLCLRTSGGDVAPLATELGLAEGMVRRIDQYEAIARPVLEGEERMPFVLKIPHAEKVPVSEGSDAEIRARMVRDGYWVNRRGQDEALRAALRDLRADVEGFKRPKPSRRDAEMQDFLASRPHLRQDEPSPTPPASPVPAAASPRRNTTREETPRRSRPSRGRRVLRLPRDND